MSRIAVLFSVLAIMVVLAMNGVDADPKCCRCCNPSVELALCVPVTLAEAGGSNPLGCPTNDAGLILAVCLDQPAASCSAGNGCTFSDSIAGFCIAIGAGKK